MIVFGMFALELLLLLVLSSRLTRLLSRILYRIFRNHGVVIHVLSYIFLPGVVVHEFSHLLMANLLFVPTGEIEFLPEIHGNEVKMGSVAIAKTDPVRRFLIGVAPLVGGLFIIFLSFWYIGSSQIVWQRIILLYVSFQVGNTMFSSRKDMEGALGFIGALILGGVVVQIIGFPLLPFLLGFSQLSLLQSLFLQMDIFIGIALAVDLFFIGLAFFGLKLSRT